MKIRLPAILKTSLAAFSAFICVNIYAQQNDVSQQQADYKKAITKRSANIVNTLGLTDSVKYNKTLQLIIDQYAQLNSMEGQPSGDKKSSELLQLHKDFIAHLSEGLTAEQVEKVKDGITYNVLNVTYSAYQDMLPNLTTEQKDKIYNWLKEAREQAMDEGSSEKKHAVFGKYKGRINNYLSEAGYDLRKEEAAWQQRIKERNAAKKQSTQ